ncbi:hypothetical protein [Nannocystis punicea]|uniref:Uncharacterized protein n=1 Tax=Nannocystis punicea TaxID=2995304 RepID=A0ABY7GYM3_9BACT|nr:hypothetical protein [Nannocystis poenicansa]WAS91997.1 hypothetical protein O0S08_37930 [Nannocystis poenicansa]
MSRRSLALVRTVAVVSLAACTGSRGDDTDGYAGTAAPTGSTGDPAPTTGEPTTGDIVPEVDWPTLECDPLVPTYCGFPFPSNVFTVADPAAPTGRRLALSGALIPDSAHGEPAQPDLWNRSDGFSPGLALMTHLPGATIGGLPGPWTLEASLAAGSPTVLIDAETGERIAHFAELDMSHDDDERRAFMLRPVVRLADDRRYIAAIRGVVDVDGDVLPPSPAFKALRDVEAFDDPSISARRGLYADIFTRLEDAGVARDDLQLAWDFTTASRENNTAGLLKMRDEALALVGDDGPAYTLTLVDAEHPDPHVGLYVEGTMTVPLYLDQPGPGAHLVLGDDGLPSQNGAAEFDFTLVIPQSAFTTPATPLQYGHGLLGSGREEVQDDYRLEFADTYGYALFAVDWIGMAADDYVPIAAFVDEGDLEQFATLVDRLHQGILNALLAMRLVSGALVDDPMLQPMGQPLIDPSERYYHGNSQGGIFGATYMALSTDVERGMLGVPGQPYNLLLDRSEDFDEFFVLLKGAFPDAIDRQMVLALFQILWDRTEPTGYSHTIRTDNLPGSPPKEVLLEVAIGDHQVSTLGAHVMARAIGGVASIAPENRAIWGIDSAAGPYTGSAMVEYDFGLAPEPTTNIPASDGEDPHGKPRRLPSAAQMLDQFLRTGVVETFCDGACDPE